MPRSSTTPEHRRRVARKYGYPWPWQVRELVEEHAVEADVDVRDLASVVERRVHYEAAPEADEE